jgi:hypothetical protein
MRGFYPVCQVTELAAGYRDTTKRLSIDILAEKCDKQRTHYEAKAGLDHCVGHFQPLKIMA